jgi:hypothetical protein
MTRLFSAELGIFAGLAVIVAVIAQLFLLTRIKLDIAHNKQTLAPFEAADLYKTWGLLRLHKSIFKISVTRRLYVVSLVILWVGFLLMFVQIVFDHFQRNNMVL